MQRATFQDNWSTNSSFYDLECFEDLILFSFQTLHKSLSFACITDITILMASKCFLLNLNKNEAIIVSPKNGISLTTNDNTVKDFGVIYDQHVSFNVPQCNTFVFLSGIFSSLVPC